MIATALELVVIGFTLAPSVIALGIIGLAGVKTILIVLFYQHLTDEPKFISIVYLAGLVAVIGLIMALVVSR